MVEFADGTTYSLRKPTYTLHDLAYGELDSELMLSPRVANQVIGMGLPEAIPEDTILGWADPMTEMPTVFQDVQTTCGMPTIIAWPSAALVGRPTNQAWFSKLQQLFPGIWALRRSSSRTRAVPIHRPSAGSAEWWRA